MSALLLLAGCSAEADSADPNASREHITYKKVRVKKSIPYSRDTVKTSTLDKGESVLDQEGMPGVRVRVVRVAFKNGVEVGRDLVKTYVKREPVEQVKLVGTNVEPESEPASSSCHPSYTGACVPIASDVDCASGSGDGPEYVGGPVRIVGDDVYDLNRDDDDIACDS